MFIHHKSAIPKQTKYNAIQNERNHIDQRCSTQLSKDKHQLDFTRTLLLNEYPPHWIQDTQLKSHTTRSRQPENNIDWLYLSIPYIADTVDHKIRNIFKREGLHVRIAYKSTTLCQILQKKKSHRLAIDKTVPPQQTTYASIRMWFIRSPVINVTSSTGCIKKMFTVGKSLLMPKAFNAYNKYCNSE